MKVEKKVKKEASFEFPPWDHINYKDQIEEYFKTIRKFKNQGFNPRSSIPTSIVSDANVEEVSGLPSNKFKTTNLHFHHHTKKELIKLYWKICNTNQVTNNKFMHWFVKANIVEEKGEIVN
jgi:hypothetical protein